MSNKGYPFEHSIEEDLLQLGEQKRETPLFERSHRIPTSGAARGMKGDVRSNIPWLRPHWIIECKHHRQSLAAGSSYKFYEKDWLDLQRDAASYGTPKDYAPVFIFCFKGQKNASYCCMSREHFSQMRAAAPSLRFYMTEIVFPNPRGKKTHFLFMHSALKKKLSVLDEKDNPFFRLAWKMEDPLGERDLVCLSWSVAKQLLASLKSPKSATEAS